jgi:sugar phosphate isomerase/epimerase
MILGISSFTYGWSLGVSGSQAFFTEKDLISKAAAFGLRCLQLGDNLPLHMMSSDRLSELKKAVDTNNIRLEVGARKLTEDHLDRYIQMTSSLQAPLLRFVVDDDEYKPEINTILSILKNALPDLKKTKITLGIENHDRFKARQLCDLMESVSDARVGICLDTVNSIGAGEGLEWVTEMLAPCTVNVHIKDFNIRRFPHNMGFIVAGAPAGKGMLDFPMVMEKLTKYNRCQSAILEQWVIPEESLNETIEKEKQWAEESIHFLKQLPYFK